LFQLSDSVLLIMEIIIGGSYEQNFCP
jgi:hypothetical protein